MYVFSNYVPLLTVFMYYCIASLDDGQLKVSFSDLLKAETHGRWWIVGSAWSGRDSTPHDAPLPQVHTETWVLELARRQRMTTDVRKTVFSVIMTSEVIMYIV